MKKSILLAGLMVASVTVAYSQGQVNFSNYFSSTAPFVGINGGVGDNGGFQGGGPNSANPGLGPTYSAQLAYYIGATSDPSALTRLLFDDGKGDSSPVPFGLGIATTDGDLGAGWFNGGVVTIPGVDASNASLITYQILVLDQNGNTVLASPLFEGEARANSTDAIPTLPTGSWQISFAAVPEPATFALAGLGAAALLIFRRRK